MSPSCGGVTSVFLLQRQMLLQRLPKLPFSIQLHLELSLLKLHLLFLRSAAVDGHLHKPLEMCFKSLVLFHK